MHKLITTALIGITTLTSTQAAPNAETSWRIDSTDDWNAASQQIEGLTAKDDLLSPTGKQGTYRSNLQRFKAKCYF